MVTYFEGSTVIDDGTGDVLVAFARQLIHGNCKDESEVDEKRITSWTDVVQAFRMHLNLADGKQLIVCIDEMDILYSHLEDIYGKAKAHKRCRRLRTALMAYQDKCTTSRSPEIRCVWTALTHLFHEELQEAKGSKRGISCFNLRNLNEDDAFKVLESVPSLQEKVMCSPKLQWAFNLCAGNPRAIVDGFMRYYKLVKEHVDTGHILLADEVMYACRFNENHTRLVGQYLTSVLTDTLYPADADKLRNEGALHVGQDHDHLNPALVYKWACSHLWARSARNLDTIAVKRQKEWLREYFGVDKVFNAKTFERQALAYEALLNSAHADRKLTPTVAEYFDPAFVEDALKDRVIIPRDAGSIVKTKNLSTCTNLHRLLKSGHSIYPSERAVGSLFPISSPEREGGRKESFTSLVARINCASM